MPDRSVLIVGATSAIAQAVARRYASAGASLFLVARDAGRLQSVADDARARGAAEVVTYTLDADDLDGQQDLLRAVESAFPSLDAALVAYGTLPDQLATERDAGAVARAFHTNATSVVALLTRLADVFERQGRGTIAVISSVAGDRGRRSNYVYGAAKGAVSLFAQGLRARLAGRGVRVVTVKPGFVDTPMTAHLPKNALFASAERVGARIHRAMESGGDVVYTPRFWQPVMAAVRAVPEAVGKRLGW